MPWDVKIRDLALLVVFFCVGPEVSQGTTNQGGVQSIVTDCSLLSAVGRCRSGLYSGRTRVIRCSGYSHMAFMRQPGGS
ncbi:hypothetical protein B0J18DRAFT_429693 [Chaetomium sp. MPI-SDFR-AT-0129]|nr:hypothetical protein B0J18DRAFT_429693 [Chaetomium sp. MPI-SDFR-AT-0129]